MAKIVEAPDWSVTGKRGIGSAGTSMYPYKEWFDGQAYELTFGEGGDVPVAKPNSWINSAKAVAVKQGLIMKAKVNEDGTVTIQTFPKAEAPSSETDDLTI